MISIYKEYIVLLFVSFRVLFCLFFDTNTHLLFLLFLVVRDGIYFGIHGLKSLRS